VDPAGAVMIVTGASSGIGAATARLAATQGARVVLVARRTDRITALAAELPDALAVTTDLREPAQGGGAIVNVSSGTSRMVLPGAGACSATKAALSMLSQVARREWARDGIVVSLVCPVGGHPLRRRRSGAATRRAGDRGAAG
jgi:NAD(P)-dependent dehydrogenase (short-subunit alcohol dehydrogenase family)